MRVVVALFVSAAVRLPASVFAIEVDEVDDERPPADARAGLSDQFLVPTGLSRFHFTPRITPSTQEGTFENDLRYSWIIQGHIGVSDSFTANFALPLGLFTPDPGPNPFVFGNVRLGIGGGNTLHLGEAEPGQKRPDLAFGGAFDMYLPTTNVSDDQFCAFLNTLGGGGVCDVSGLIRNLHSSEPELFISDAMLFKLRGHAELRVSIINAQFELGLSPGFTTRSDSDFLMLLSWAGRLGVRPTYGFEGFVEAGSSIQLAGPDSTLLAPDNTTPVLLTFGGRAFISGFTPALFMSIDLRDSFVIFGLDIAGTLANRTVEDRDTGGDFLERM